MHMYGISGHKNILFLRSAFVVGEMQMNEEYCLIVARVFEHDQRKICDTAAHTENKHTIMATHFIFYY